WLAGYRFRGDVSGYPEGELFFPGSPILTVTGTFAECVILETVILSVLNHDCAIAAAAARMVTAAGGRPLIEMGSRRTHEQAAVAAARAAYLAGFAGTSNLAARRRDGVPTMGTAAHAFTPPHGAGAGTAVVTGSGAPTAGMVYKLVEVDGRPVAKRSEHKATVGGRKIAVRRHKPTGTAVEEVLAHGTPPAPEPGDRALQVPLIRAGEPVPAPSLEESRERLRAALVAVPWEGLKLSRGEPAIPTTYGP